MIKKDLVELMNEQWRVDLPKVDMEKQLSQLVNLFPEFFSVKSTSTKKLIFQVRTTDCKEYAKIREKLQNVANQ